MNCLASYLNIFALVINVANLLLIVRFYRLNIQADANAYKLTMGLFDDITKMRFENAELRLQLTLLTNEMDFLKKICNLPKTHSQSSNEDSLHSGTQYSDDSSET